MCVVSSESLRSALRVCLQYVVVRVVMLPLQTDRVCKFTPNQLKHFQWARSWVLASLVAMNTYRIALSSVSHCFALVFHHFGGKVAWKYARTNGVKHVRHSIYFALPRITLNANNVLIRHSATVRKLRCFYAHDFMRKSDDYSENAARRLIGIIRSCLFARFSVRLSFWSLLLFIAGSVDFLTPPNAFRCSARIPHLPFGHTHVRIQAERYFRCDVCFLMCLFVFFSCFSSIQTNWSERICRFINKLG